MKTYAEIKQPNKNYLYLIKDGHSRMTATEVWNSISSTYMGVEFKFWDDNIQWMFRNKELIEDMYPSAKDGLEKHGYVKTEPTSLELSLYSRKEELV